MNTPAGDCVCHAYSRVVLLRSVLLIIRPNSRFHLEVFLLHITTAGRYTTSICLNTRMYDGG